MKSCFCFVLLKGRYSTVLTFQTILCISIFNLTSERRAACFNIFQRCHKNPNVLLSFSSFCLLDDTRASGEGEEIKGSLLPTHDIYLCYLVKGANSRLKDQVGVEEE